MRYLFLASVLVGLSVFTGCSQGSPDDSSDEGAVEATTDNATARFFAGLAAPPGSPERKQAGAMLEQKLQQAYAQFRTSAGDEEERNLTKKIFGFTVEYMKSDASAMCPADRKVRVYRGYGAQLLLHPQGAPDQRFHLFGDWGYAIAKELESSLASAPDPGELAFQSAGSLGTSSFDKLDFATLLGKRQYARARSEQDLINLSWSSLASTHTVTSRGSPLISTALKTDAANDFGPGFIVADLCPERAIPLESTFAFGETEVYVPLFLLPEEIVRVEGADCGLSIKRTGAKRDSCFNGELADRDPKTALSRAMTSCYVNFGYKAEYKRYSPGRQIVENRFFDTQTAMKQPIASSNRLSEVRSRALAIETACAELRGCGRRHEGHPRRARHARERSE